MWINSIDKMWIKRFNNNRIISRIIKLDKQSNRVVKFIFFNKSFKAELNLKIFIVWFLKWNCDNKWIKYWKVCIDKKELLERIILPNRLIKS